MYEAVVAVACEAPAPQVYEAPAAEASSLAANSASVVPPEFPAALRTSPLLLEKACFAWPVPPSLLDCFAANRDATSSDARHRNIESESFQEP